ncbi:MAG: B12-binding domain-containing radical SAM protein [Candidatus Aenigmarchaeota archaeon]|nr:B12-binding domain-containing radical SAM protein [Candidatus Aenigmarchaeota archaeon]
MGEKQLYDFVITADESCMHNYNMSFMAGFLSCVPIDRLPKQVKEYIENRFFSTVPNNDGKAELAILSLRKIESYLTELGYNVVVCPPQLVQNFDAKVWLVSTMDPFGIGPATTTMVGLAGGKEPFNKYFFERLIGKIRERSNAPIIAGGPGVWEFDLFKEEQARMNINCVFTGAVESAPREFWQSILEGRVPEKYHNIHVMRPDPYPIIGTSFWGMVEISRGCGRGCQFCDMELMSGFKWIPKEFIIKEAELNAESPYTDTITLLSEDTLRYGTAVGEWKPNGKINELCKELVKFGKPLSFTHCCLATALANPRVTEEFSEISGLSEKRMTGFQTGIESGSPRIIARYMVGKLKPWKPEDWPEVVEQGMAVMIDNYIIPHCTIVMGLPEETPDDTVKTIELIDRLQGYPSLILPLFFVPLSVIKDRPFVADMLSSEQRDLLIASARHTAKWAQRLPNWSGSLGLKDKIVFTAGARYCFDFMETLKTGEKWDMTKMLSAVMKASLAATWDHMRHRGQKLEYWNKTKRQYPVVERISQMRAMPMIASMQADRPPGSGCGCGMGGTANNLMAENLSKGL